MPIDSDDEECDDIDEPAPKKLTVRFDPRKLPPVVIRMLVAGQSQCDVFAEICLVLDYLNSKLPNFCYERQELPAAEWPAWLCKVNQKFGWHHDGSPIVWKELLIKGSKPYYIGGAPEFLEYCHSYYNLDIFINPTKFEGLIKNFSQFKKKIKEDEKIVIKPKTKKTASILQETKPQTDYVICIYGASSPLTKSLIALLLEMSVGPKSITKIYIYDSSCSIDFMTALENQCMYIGTNQSGKVIKHIDKIGLALTHSDVLIVLKHVPFKEDMAIGDWLYANRMEMEELAPMINASGSRKMYVIFPNLGPACYNATVLMSLVNISKYNIVVATADLGLDVITSLADVVEIPAMNIFCPPVWGFVGINHLVDCKTTYHKYHSFEPYDRYTRVKESTLEIGCLTPEIRSLEYLMLFEETIWLKRAEVMFLKGWSKYYSTNASVNLTAVSSQSKFPKRCSKKNLLRNKTAFDIESELKFESSVTWHDDQMKVVDYAFNNSFDT